VQAVVPAVYAVVQASAQHVVVSVHVAATPVKLVDNANHTDDDIEFYLWWIDVCRKMHRYMSP